MRFITLHFQSTSVAFESVRGKEEGVVAVAVAVVCHRPLWATFEVGNSDVKISYSGGRANRRQRLDLILVASGLLPSTKLAGFVAVLLRLPAHDSAPFVRQ